MADPLELAGLLVACGAAAATVLAPNARWQPLAAAIALAAAPILVLGDVWDDPRVVDVRESPALLAAGLFAGSGAIGAGALLIRRFEWAFPVLTFGVLALRLPVEIAGETSNLLIPLYLVIGARFVASLGLERGSGADRDEVRAAVWLRRALALTLVLYAAQAAYSDDVSNAIENAGFFLVPFAILFTQLAAVRWTAATLRATTIAIAAVGAALAAVAIGQFLARDLFLNAELQDSNELKPFFRVNSLFFDPNVLGRYMALGVITVGAAVAWSRGGRAAVLATAAGVLMAAALTVSYSITSAAALIVGMGVLALLRFGRLGALATAAALALTAIAFAVSGGADRSDLGPTRGIGEETSGRVDLLEGAWELIEEEPALGWGSGAFGRAFFNEIRRTKTTASHSEPVTVAAEQGVPGTLVYVALLGTALWVLFSGGAAASAARAAAAAGTAALIVHSLGYAGFLSDPATWALLAVAVGVRRDGGEANLAPEP